MNGWLDDTDWERETHEYFIPRVVVLPENISRGGEVVSRWVHYPKVNGSNPFLATNKNYRLVVE